MSQEFYRVGDFSLSFHLHMFLFLPTVIDLIREGLNTLRALSLAVLQICSLDDRQSLSICCRNSFNGQELEHIKICQKGIRTYLNENTFYQKQALRRKMEEWAEPSF